MDALVSQGFQPCFQEQDLGGVVGMLCEHAAAAGPWGDDVEWNSEAYDIVSLSNMSLCLHMDICVDTPGPMGVYPALPYGSSIHSPAVPFGAW